MAYPIIIVKFKLVFKQTDADECFWLALYTRTCTLSSTAINDFSAYKYNYLSLVVQLKLQSRNNKLHVNGAVFIFEYVRAALVKCTSAACFLDVSA